MKKMTPEELEKFIHQQLRGLPDRPAPRSLESRVMAALQHQAVIPWYHQSWSYWPAPLRMAFLVVAVGATVAVLAGFYLGFNAPEASAVVAQASERLSIFSRIYHVANWISAFCTQVVGSIPPLVLYAGLAVIAAIYATFLGLGAAAYRALYRNN